MSFAILIRALVAQGKLNEARMAAAQAEALAKRTQNVFERLEFAISVARLSAAVGGTATARRELEAILAEAQEYGFYALQLEARLGLGEVEVRMGTPSVGRARLNALRAEAGTKGYGLIARKAAAALVASPKDRAAVGQP